MFSLEGDRAVSSIVENFLPAANSCTEIVNMPLGQTRLNFLQNAEIVTANGYEYDYFMRHTN